MSRRDSCRPLGLAALTCCAFLTACGSDSNGDDADPGVSFPTELSAECEAIIDTCLENQRSCQTVGGQAECFHCPAGHYAGQDGICTVIPGEMQEQTWDQHTVPPGYEIKDECRSWTLNNPTELWVNAVELIQDEASHHSNWMFAPEGNFDGPDGFWPCADRKYTQLQAALAGGALFAQSTQATKEVQRFPPGAAVRIPPYSRILSDVHILNTSSETVTGSMTFRIFTIDASEVTTKLTPFHVSYEALEIPPRATSRFTGECDYEETWQNMAESSFNPQLYYVLPHTHALGTRFFLELMGGSRDGETIIDVSGFNGEARGRAYWNPLDFSGATGLRFGCEFTNPRDETVRWGFGDQEMCEALGFFASPLAFETFVIEANEDGKDGEVFKFTGPCETQAFPWSQEKEGGVRE